MAHDLDYSATYRNMADEQLLALLSSRDDLQDAAVAALETEIQRRGLKPGTEAETPKPEPLPEEVSPYARVSQRTPSDFVETYRARRRAIAPPSCLP